MNKLLPFDTPPDFVNEQGVKWWRDDSSTRYARLRNSQGNCLPNAEAWLVEEPNGNRTRLLVNDGTIVAEDQTLDGFGSKIDMLKALKRFT